MVNQYRVLWSIPNAGPSVSTFHSSGNPYTAAATWASLIGNLFVASQTYIPNEVTISFDTEVTVYDDETGQLSGSVPLTGPTAFTGSATGTWAAGAGARIEWGTGVIRNGRRVRGATFMVPLASGTFTSSGTVLLAYQTTMQTAATNYITASEIAGTPAVVYSRPTSTRPGVVTPINSGIVPPLAATLRGRKY